ncbi:hypothetical protein DYBT9623_00040 [Dyadobacter sp. CECT 9623]|uniref:PDZ domain-containing protein n=1 Tax=Dyadobacter linearis TaxID=2823330 RepID=A0ABM8UJC0_9BACT|nr:S41 family peptidase [Dyadobacter sp. CECT 9623]CAG5067320.1 hypothetical protein DYBT9623_00040 [Dyadobacter sp. CECT 9623]
MKKLRKRSAILFTALVSFCCACQPESIDTLTGKLGDKGSVNEWVYSMMADAYFWYDELPDQKQLDSSASPEEYFSKLVYQPQTYDRFSMLTADIDALQQQFNGLVTAFGVSYVPAFIDEGKQNVALFVSHVAKDSPADKVGLTRGDIITKIDGSQLTKDNYNSLMSSKESAKMTLGAIENNTLHLDKSTVSITKAALAANPVAFSSVISKGGKKIGYLVYTQFVPGTDADKQKYDNELRSIFGQFKSAGVNELVLDLRLNGGGYMTSAVTLGSLIVSNAGAADIFYKEQWNDKYIKYWKEKNGQDALNYKFSQESSNIGNRLDRVYVLTSRGTASASELIINGLKPYMQVVTIGANTAGKNLFGSLIGDEKKRWKYGIYMMLGQTTNADGESDYGTVDGITPTRKVEDSSMPFLPFGDENETLLNAALQDMGVSAGPNARIGAVKRMESASPSPLKDTPAALDGIMLRNLP